MNLMLMVGAIAMTATTGEPAMPPALASLVEAERAFAKMSVTVSMRDAFLANLAADAVLFNPGPVNGPALYRDRPVTAAVLSWRPSYAEIAGSSDFGFTTGPWEFRRDPDSEPVAFGHFVSVWKKQADGRWKVALDVGITHDALDSAPPLTVRPAENAEYWPLDAGGVAAARESLLDTDRAFALAFAHGAAAAYRRFGADDVRRYRDGGAPVAGRDAVARACGEAGGGTVMRATEAVVARSGDLGYTTGIKGAPVTAYYVRIWRMDEKRSWKIVLDLDSNVPAEGE